MPIVRTTDPEAITLLNREIQALHASMYPDHFREFDYEAVYAFFKEVMSNSRFQFYLLTIDELPAGYAWIELRDYAGNAFLKPSRSVFVHHLCIAEAHRGQGYGQRFMDRIAEIAKENGIQKIELDYWTDNEAAQCFYEKNGFQAYRKFVYQDLV